MLRKKSKKQKLPKKQPRRSQLELLEKYRQDEHKIIKIQALWRARQTRRQLISVLQQTKPLFKVVKLFLPHLQFTTEDYDRELQLQVSIKTVKTNIFRFYVYEFLAG